ncbi:MAG: RNA polymerase sigma factor [Chloroflexota bacterium]
MPGAWRSVQSAPPQADRTRFVEQLYDDYHRLALGVAYRVVGNQAEAEEVVQDAFLEVWRAGDKYSAERGAARSWLLTTVRNRAIDRLRRRRHTIMVELDNAGDRGMLDGALDGALWAVDAEQARRALAELPATQREALELAYFDAWTHSEIAERLHLPIGTVKGRIRLGLIRLRVALLEH